MKDKRDFWFKNRTFFYASTTIVSLLVVSATVLLGYIHYKKIDQSKKSLEIELENIKNKKNSESKSLGMEMGGGGLDLQTTNNPTEAGIPLDVDRASSINMNPGGGDMSSASGQQMPQQPGQQPPTNPMGEPAAASQPSSPVTKIEDTDALNKNKWKTYNNDKYKYSFKYPREFNSGECSSDPEPCKLGKIIESEGGNNVDLSSTFEGQTWPKITITHSESEEYNLPADKNLIDWVKEKFTSVASSLPKNYNITIKSKSGNPEKGLKVKIDDPSTEPAANLNSNDNSKEDKKENYHYEVFVEKSGKIFKFNLQGIDGQKAKDFYDDWLDEIKL